MRTTTQARKLLSKKLLGKRNGHSNGKTLQASKILRPLKRANKRIITYVTHKPKQSLGIATLLTGLCVSLIYARMRK